MRAVAVNDTEAVFKGEEKRYVFYCDRGRV